MKKIMTILMTLAISSVAIASQAVAGAVTSVAPEVVSIEKPVDSSAVSSDEQSIKDQLATLVKNGMSPVDAVARMIAKFPDRAAKITAIAMTEYAPQAAAIRSVALAAAPKSQLAAIRSVAAPEAPSVALIATNKGTSLALNTINNLPASAAGPLLAGPVPAGPVPGVAPNFTTAAPAAVVFVPSAALIASVSP